MAYDPHAYWTAQHEREDLSSVGQAGYSPGWNAWLYRAWLKTGLRFLRQHEIAAASVCDVGAGRGSWFPVWRAIGAECITAVDRVDAAVSGLPAESVVMLDIGEAGAVDTLGTFDLVAAMYVLLHVTDDGAFSTACENLARLVRSGGHLLLAEPMLFHRDPRRARSGAESRARRPEDYHFPGLTLVAIGAATIIASDPIEARSWWKWPQRAFWGVLARTGSRFPALVGPIVARLDPWLVRHTTLMPSAKLAIYRRG